MQAGGEYRLEALVSEWSAYDPEGANAWLADREYRLLQVTANAERHAIQGFQQEANGAYLPNAVQTSAPVLATWQAAKPRSLVA